MSMIVEQPAVRCGQFAQGVLRGGIVGKFRISIGMQIANREAVAALDFGQVAIRRRMQQAVVIRESSVVGLAHAAWLPIPSVHRAGARCLPSLAGSLAV